MLQRLWQTSQFVFPSPPLSVCLLSVLGGKAVTFQPRVPLNPHPASFGEDPGKGCVGALHCQNSPGRLQDRSVRSVISHYSLRALFSFMTPSPSFPSAAFPHFSPVVAPMPTWTRKRKTFKNKSITREAGRVRRARGGVLDTFSLPLTRGLHYRCEQRLPSDGIVRQNKSDLTDSMIPWGFHGLLLNVDLTFSLAKPSSSAPVPCTSFVMVTEISKLEEGVKIEIDISSCWTLSFPP